MDISPRDWHQFEITHGFPSYGTHENSCKDRIIFGCNAVGIMTDDSDLQTDDFMPLHMNLLRFRINALNNEII